MHNNYELAPNCQKFGFHIMHTKEQYYKRIDPPHTFALQKDTEGPLGLPIVSHCLLLSQYSFSNKITRQ